MVKDFEKIIKEKFPKGTLTKFRKYTNGHEYRVNIIKRELARDLDLICSERSFRHLNLEGDVISEVEDVSVDYISGNLLIGYNLKHTQEDSNNKDKLLLSKVYENPVLSKEPLLLFKTTKLTNTVMGYFNKIVDNVYIII